MKKVEIFKDYSEQTVVNQVNDFSKRVHVLSFQFSTSMYTDVIGNYQGSYSSNSYPLFSVMVVYEDADTSTPI